MFNILKICNTQSLNVESKLSVFDTYVSSLLNYGCEVWGFHPAHDVERVHLDFCKRILRIKKSTSNFMIYSELGRVPLQICRKVAIIRYWLKIIESDNCILRSLYDDMCESLITKSNWASQIRDLLFSLGFGYAWFNQYVENKKIFLINVKTRLFKRYVCTRNEFFF